jgi:hypothetical protein
VADRTEKRTEKRTEEEEDSPPSPSHRKEHVYIEDPFRRFWAVYPKHIGKAPAAKAFTTATQNGADPEKIIEGAKRYAAERHGQGERYTAYPAKWLREERWNDQPQAGAVIDQEGNPVQPAHSSGIATSYTMLGEMLIARQPKWKTPK